MPKVAHISTPVPLSAASEKSDSAPFVSVALFCAIGLLVSLAVIVADQYLPGEWF